MDVKRQIKASMKKDRSSRERFYPDPNQQKSVPNQTDLVLVMKGLSSLILFLSSTVHLMSAEKRIETRLITHKSFWSFITISFKFFSFLKFTKFFFDKTIIERNSVIKVEIDFW